MEDEDNEELRKAKGPDVEKEPSEIESMTVHPPRKWLFRVQVSDTRSTEIVCVTGDLPELGTWFPEKAKPLQQEGNTDVWSAVIEIPDRQVINYRFCVNVIVEPGNKVIVRNWESNLNARSIGKMASSPTIQDFPLGYGVGENSMQEHMVVNRGWLTKEVVVQLKLCNNPLTIFKPTYENRRLFIKVTPVKLNKFGGIPKTVAQALEESLSSDTMDIEPAKYAYTEVICMNDEEKELLPQEQFGKEFKPDHMLMYQCTVICMKTTAFLLDLYVHRSNCSDGEPPYHAGYCYVLPTSLNNSEGGLIIPITSTKHRPLGQITVQYLVVRPLPDFKCNMSQTYTRYWNKKRSGLDVGHRGSGSSFKMSMKNCAEIRENTIASMKTAINHGADYVEFDVQLSKDLVPVIYHDFHVCVSLKRKKHLEQSDMLEIPVKELTLEHLRQLKIYHLTEGKTQNQKFFDEDLEEHQPFPTLQQCLETLDINCGFNIEIKWTMQLFNDTFELYHPMDVNLYLDIIMDVVMRYSGTRKIVFSCFNPDVCTMIRLKQNKYPVMFLTQGTTERFERYKDPRCWTIHSAVQFAEYSEILGVNVHSEDILRDPSLVGVAVNANLVLFCWGDDNADPDTIKYLKDLGLHGVIYDKIYVYGGKDAVKDSIYVLSQTQEFSSKYNATSDYLQNAHNVQEQLDQLEKPTGLVAVPAPGSADPRAGRVLNVDISRRILGEVSTATSIASLESNVEEYLAHVHTIDCTAHNPQNGDGGKKG